MDLQASFSLNFSKKLGIRYFREKLIENKIGKIDINIVFALILLILNNNENRTVFRNKRLKNKASSMSNLAPFACK